MKRPLAVVAGLAAAAALVLGLGTSVLVGMNVEDESTNLDLEGSTCLVGGGDVTGLDAVQAERARAIVQAGIDLGIPDRGLVVAIITALQEAGLRNLASRANPGSIDFPHDGVAAGDHDSVGLFQQRDAWGPLAVRMDPVQSATMFYTGGQAGQRGLLDIAGWETMPTWQAAQSVQVSAFPTAYAKHEGLAVATVASITGGGMDCTAPVGTCPPTGLGGEAGLTPDALNTFRCGAAQTGWTNIGGVGARPNNPTSDHPMGRAVDFMVPNWSTPDGRAAGWVLAEWMRAHAAELGITYVIFDVKIWRAGTDDWRPYGHPSGGGGPTLLHQDHVHVSVSGASGTLVTGSAL